MSTIAQYSFLLILFFLLKPVSARTEESSAQVDGLFQLVRYALAMESYPEAASVLDRLEPIVQGSQKAEWQSLRQRLEISRERAYFLALEEARNAAKYDDRMDLEAAVNRALRANPEGTEAVRLADELQATEDARQVQDLVQTVEHHVQQARWNDAQRILAEAIRRFPNRPEWSPLDHVIREGRDRARVSKLRAQWSGNWRAETVEGAYRWWMDVYITLDDAGAPKILVRELGEARSNRMNFWGWSDGTFNAHRSEAPGHLTFYQGLNHPLDSRLSYNHQVVLGRLEIINESFDNAGRSLMFEVRLQSADPRHRDDEVKITLHSRSDDHLTWRAVSPERVWNYSNALWRTSILGSQPPPHIPHWPEHLELLKL